jgi:hypothetical protein
MASIEQMRRNTKLQSESLKSGETFRYSDMKEIIE